MMSVVAGAEQSVVGDSTAKCHSTAAPPPAAAAAVVLLGCAHMTFY